MALEKIKSERILKVLKPGTGRINDGGGLYLVGISKNTVLAIVKRDRAKLAAITG